MQKRVKPISCHDCPSKDLLRFCRRFKSFGQVVAKLGETFPAGLKCNVSLNDRWKWCVCARACMHACVSVCVCTKVVDSPLAAAERSIMD